MSKQLNQVVNYAAAVACSIGPPCPQASQQGPDESPLPGKGLDYGAEDEEEAAVAAAAGTQSQQLPASQEQQQQQRLEAAAAGAGGGREAGLQGVAGLLGPGVVAGGLWG
jgi:hypothetical protein